MEVETDASPPGTVVHEMQAGYTIADRLLRPAMVGIAKAAPPASSPATRAWIRSVRSGDLPHIMVRDAELGSAPHHEGLKNPHPEEAA